jgi:LmbE family N-acetylglucosaminyl deacetylase
VIQVDVLLVLLTALLLICSVFARGPKSFLDPPRHVLISCAHSDDCIITGAEYAYGAVQKGLSIRVAYLTCSAPHPDTEIARIRKAEALAAWSALGVPKENLTFINLRESPVVGPVSYSEQEIARAKEVIEMLIRSMPENAALIVPAQGESHVDHRTVQSVTLRALVNTNREDIIVYETPEYNAFLSVVQCPKRAIRAVLRCVPLLNRFVKPYSGPSNYINGPPGSVFRDTPNRLAKKIELLRYFASQNGEQLVRSFGYQTLYRQLSFMDIRHRPNRVSCISAFGGCCGVSVLALGSSLLGVAFLSAHEIGTGLTIALSPRLPINEFLISLGGLFAFAYVVRAFYGTANLATSLIVWAAVLGLISGTFD